MGKIAQILGEEIEKLIVKEVRARVKKREDFELFNGTEACETFGITRCDLNKIDPTYIEGYTKPRYMRKNILRYLQRKTAKANARKTTTR